MANFHRYLAKSGAQGGRWLLLKNPEYLDDAKDELKQLRETLELNAPPGHGLLLQRRLATVVGTNREAGTFLTYGIKTAEASGVKMLIQFARTPTIHRAGILAWYNHQISTGPLEGTNNKIRTLTRVTYGYRDREFFILRLHALHEAKFKLVG